MLTMILTDVQYIQNVVFSFEKGSNDQTHSSSDSNHPIKKNPAKFLIPLHWGVNHLPLNTI